jgi:hypothetical protein
MKKKLYWLASYPKSGNTWFRIFLSHYLTGNEDINNLSHLGTMASSKKIIKRYNPNFKRYYDAEQKNALRRDGYIEYNRILNENNENVAYNKIHDAYRIIENKPMIPEEVSAGVIYFIRNPFDVCVSFANHMGFSLDKSVNNMNDDGFMIGNGKKQLKQHLLSWSNHVKSWTEQDKIPILIIKYEDMLNDTFNLFSTAIKFLNIEYDEEKIKKSIDFSSFENLKKKEETNGFKEKPDKSDGFFKVGTANYGKNILSEKQKELIFENHKDVMNIYGYNF